VDAARHAVSAGRLLLVLDADSEHEEGKFYVWTPEKVRVYRERTAEEYAVAAAALRPRPDAPNFEGAHWHLRVARNRFGSRRRTGQAAAPNAKRLLASARDQAPGGARGARPPGRDEKILTAWNALMPSKAWRACRPPLRARRLAGLGTARASTSSERHALARRSACSPPARTAARISTPISTITPILLAAAIELLQARFDKSVLAFAESLAGVLLEQFEDKDAGGFFFTGHDHES
jgi:uncharacterized protein YyaL (SSP411 family)